MKTTDVNGSGLRILKRNITDQYAPYIEKNNLFEYLNFICCITSVGLLFYSAKSSSTDVIFKTGCTLLVFLSLSYATYLHLKKKHRYAMSGLYFHSVAHLMRDFLSKLKRSCDTQSIPEDIYKEYEATLVACINVISEYFTLLNREKCCVCIKEIQPHETIQTLVRDQYSSIIRFGLDGKSKELKHSLSENTDFSFLFYGANPQWYNCFLSNNLIKLWNEGKYENSTLKLMDDKPRKHYGFFSRMLWPLPYKSTMVFPLRYFEPGEKKQCRGFLCVDAARVRAFNFKYQVNLGATFADMLYIFMTQFEFILDIYTSPHEDIK